MPQLPFSHFKLHFREGASSSRWHSRPACGTYDAEADPLPLVGRSRRSPPPRPSRSSAAPNGGPCPSGGLPPFHPGLIAGTDQQRRRALLPLQRAPAPAPTPNRRSPTSRSSCRRASSASWPASPSAPTRRSPRPRRGPAPTAARKSSNSPSCPAASEVGRTLAGAGVGRALAYAPGKLYLAGPYHGSALSHRRDHRRQGRPLRPRHRGRPRGLQDRPRNRRSLHRRHRLGPDPPHHQGHPGPPRDIRAYVDRPEFILNPTSCERTSTASHRARLGPRLRLRSRRQPGHGLHPLPGRRLRRPSLQAEAHPEAEGRHQARRPPGPQRQPRR